MSASALENAVSNGVLKKEQIGNSTELPEYYIEDKEKEDEKNEKKKQKNKKKDDDVWGINYDEDDDQYESWNEMSTKNKVKSATINTIKICLALCCLYLFICSISMLGDAFQILAGKSAGAIFANDSFLSNPITGFIIGILVTVLVQSSSTSTSIIITMVAAKILSVQQAIYIIMGANIGTSVTNTIVALSQSMDKEQFRKAFAGATVHDIFNYLSVAVLLPLEVVSGYLYALTKAIIDSFHIQGGGEEVDILKAITEPLTKGIAQVNKTVITLVAQNVYLEPESSMIKIWCEQTTGFINRTELVNGTAEPSTDMTTGHTLMQYNDTHLVEVKVGVRKCKSPDDFLFANTGLSDVEAGVILLFFSLILLSSCLILMVKLLNSLLRGSVSRIIKKVINTNFRYPFGWVTGYLAIIVGAGLTFVVQSSSVFTSTMTPLVGIGVISLKRMYPLTLGSNIGTTTTSILAALAGENLELTLQLALVHLFFNVSGIVIWYPIPFMRHIPLRAAKTLGNTTAKYRWFAVLYLISLFFLFPAALLGLSVADFWALMSVIIVVVVTVAFIIVINVLRTRRPQWLPEVLRTWLWLPVWLRSLEPYDKVMSRYLLCCCRNVADTNNLSDTELTSEHSSSDGALCDGHDNLGYEDEVTATKL
ncbi:unnamed protein product [Clavelina lepadiformis]|uniref:Sodium-dependent phosphate transport protein 2B n=2 Tax=Clavelina lepadiformis TaxID=159417 RepID=A0ABP0FXJ5_CLALP